MTEKEAEIAILTYQRRQREVRNRELYLGMREFFTAEQFLSALHSLSGLNTEEREAARKPKLLQTFA